MGRSIYFISDTHLGDGSLADRFLHPGPLMRLLDKIEADPDAELVLLGDFLELWSASLDGILVQYAPVFHALCRVAATMPVTYVVGNHDCLPWYHYLGAALGHMRITERYEALRGALVAVHGHQYDPFNQVEVTEGGQLDLPWTRRLVQVLGVVQRLGGQPAASAVNSVSDWVAMVANRVDELFPGWDPQSRERMSQSLRQVSDVARRESPGMRGYPIGETRYEAAAAKLMRQGARFVLMGHTHHPLTRRWGERIYVNTGCWVWNQYPPTYAVWRSGTLILYDATTDQEFSS